MSFLPLAAGKPKLVIIRRIRRRIVIIIIIIIMMVVIVIIIIIIMIVTIVVVISIVIVIIFPYRSPALAVSRANLYGRFKCLKCSRPWDLNYCMYASPENDDGFTMILHINICIWIWDSKPSI